MSDRRLLPDEDLTPRTLCDAITGALPHGGFQIDPMPHHGPEVLRISCRCGRALRWIGYLPSDVLFWWLADHNDEMFLTRAELERKYNEQIPEHLDMTRLTLPAGIPGLLNLPEMPEPPRTPIADRIPRKDFYA